MALTIDASGITTISTAESTTGWTGPTLSQENEIIKEGLYSISSIVRNNGTQEYYNVTNQNYSSKHLRLWVSTGVYSLMNTTGKTGLKFFVSSGNGQDSYWNIADSSTYQGGWINIVVDANSPDISGATITSINDIGIEFGLTASSKRVVNTYVDYLRYGDGYTLYGTNWTFEDVILGDVSAGYGIVTKYEGSFFATGSLQIGRNTEITTISESGSVLTFVDAPVDPSLYGITLVGYTGSNFNFSGNVFSAAGSQHFYLSFGDTTINDLQFINNTVHKASKVILPPNSINNNISGNTFNDCGLISVNGIKFENNSINNTTETTYGSIHVISATDLNYSKNILLNGFSASYGIYVDASITSITLDNFQFDVPDGTGGIYALYWAGTSGTLTVINTNGTNLLVSGTNTAGGTVDVQVSASISLTGLKDNTEVRFYTSDLSTELYGVENSIGGTVTYNYSSIETNVIIQIFSVGYDTVRLTGIDLNGVNTSIPVQQKVDRWYKN